MKAVIAIGILAFTLSTVVCDMAGECNMAGFYLELGCTPFKIKNGTICPQAFQCPDLHPDKTKCFYRGKAYRDRTALPQAVVKNPCSQACSCSVEDGEARFDCASIDCVETFDADMADQCINTYELDSCCSIDTVCGKDKIQKLKTCEVDGVIYREGESFEPVNTRKTCICTAKFNGSYDNPEYCRDINCGIELHYQEKIMKRCAPVFVSNVKTGCPIGFECPLPESRVRLGRSPPPISSQCVFGKLVLAVGDEVTVTETCNHCVCEVPPFLSCTRKNCDPPSYGSEMDNVMGMGLRTY